MKYLYRFSLILAISFLFSACYGTQEQVKKVQESLSGNWELIGLLYEKNTIDGLFPSKRPTVSFDIENEIVSGFNGCNTFNGPIFSNRLSLTVFIKKVKSTKMACGSDGEKVFMQLLGQITSYRIDEQNELELFIKTQRIMSFKRLSN